MAGKTKQINRAADKVCQQPEFSILKSTLFHPQESPLTHLEHPRVRE